MRVKKYTASSMPEAMKQVRAELGSDAVILNSRVIQTSGFMGFFRKNSIEIIAAVDPEAVTANKPDALDKVQRETYNNPTATVKGRQHVPEVSAPQHGVSDHLLKEITQLKNMIKTNDSGSILPAAIPEPIRSQIVRLKDQEINTHILDTLTASLLEKWYLGGGTAQPSEIEKWCAEEIEKKLSAYPFGGISFKKKFINIVGPTGVGKTTTLAKIAAESVLKHQKKVAFITTDTYRIAAIDQLKTYAKILDVPIEVCYNLEDFKGAEEKFAEYDQVFIDTAGRNFRNPKYVTDLKKAIDFDSDIETYLVLALTSKQRDMEEIRKQFSLINIDKFIFTKADETSVYGSILNMAEKFSTGVAYMTNGQDVPDDLIVADPKAIANTILGVSSYG
jgi:flagellar biosynthesis protein FlhF